MSSHSIYSVLSLCVGWLFLISVPARSQINLDGGLPKTPVPQFDEQKQPQPNNSPRIGPAMRPRTIGPQPRELPRTRAEQLAAANHRPNAENGFRQSPEKTREIQQDMMDLLQQDMQKRQVAKQQQHYRTNDWQPDISGYVAARNTLLDMLQGRRPLSLKDAYYAAEQAHGDLHLGREEYNDLLQENAHFIRQWLQENGMDIHDPEALHYGIQQFMTDTLTVTVNDPEFGGRQTLNHVPYYYDYIDYQGTEDRRNYFITKTLATGTGQCHTLPVTYLLLAEALGADVFLSYNPQHSFVRFQNNSGMWVNYETTIGRFIPDQFYLDEMPMMAVAHQNGLYVNQLSKQQVVATVLLDLAVSFIGEHWVADGSFIQSCVDGAMTQFPNRLFINTAGHYVNRKMLSAQFNDAALKYNITHFSQVQQYPEVQRAYDLLQEYLAEVQRLGVNAYPEAEYLQMISYHDAKGRLQESKKVEAKSKKSLFTAY